MKLNIKVVLIFSSLMTFTSLSLAQTSDKVSNKPSADNSKINERDTTAKELTADQQKSNASDSEISAKIRRDIMQEKNMSTYAQNIKIITVNGKVTLKGPVRSTVEENNILKYARTLVGASNVVNEIEITPKKTY